MYVLPGQNLCGRPAASLGMAAITARDPAQKFLPTQQEQQRCTMPCMRSCTTLWIISMLSGYPDDYPVQLQDKHIMPDIRHAMRDIQFILEIFTRQSVILWDKHSLASVGAGCHPLEVTSMDWPVQPLASDNNPRHIRDISITMSTTAACCFRRPKTMQHPAKNDAAPVPATAASSACRQTAQLSHHASTAKLSACRH